MRNMFDASLRQTSNVAELVAISTFTFQLLLAVRYRHCVHYQPLCIQLFFMLFRRFALINRKT
ncbi:hypothetical protein PHET_02759 [Paragonimus heterotremus]|uniref:Uncharacterized protein n=1 Tax=Paragonimus heterotremus TaxID=100268 RepID=A0A8J4TPL8_9TREM|nr:hypothetical protein PHET_02759 [Paragonimus heterotremus]